jgi:hypothetical protein
MSSGISNPGDNVAEPGSSPLNYLYCQAIPTLALFAFKAITELYLYPLHAQYYLVMYCTKCNTKNLWNQFQKKQYYILFGTHCPATRKKPYKILGTVVFWVTTLCNPTLACQRFERISSIFKVHNYPAKWGSRFLRNHTTWCP